MKTVRSTRLSACHAYVSRIRHLFTSIILFYIQSLKKCLASYTGFIPCNYLASVDRIVIINVPFYSKRVQFLLYIYPYPLNYLRCELTRRLRYDKEAHFDTNVSEDYSRYRVIFSHNNRILRIYWPIAHYFDIDA